MFGNNKIRKAVMEKLDEELKVQETYYTEECDRIDNRAENEKRDLVGKIVKKIFNNLTN